MWESNPNRVQTFCAYKEYSNRTALTFGRTRTEANPSCVGSFAVSRYTGADGCAVVGGVGLGRGTDRRRAEVVRWGRAGCVELDRRQSSGHVSHEPPGQRRRILSQLHRRLVHVAVFYADP